ncbi:M48 family metalloprotease [Nocardioides houyundeii]|uniref:M48 family metalloprotease n=1 Tax=Nocardioides houyundeii TaxID=2045452 RepID=UPI001F530ECB|nr:M48 family metalloprotease [Nocardioides houyundeii]
MTPPRLTSRVVGWLVAATAGACFLVLAAVLVPWHPVPDGLAAVPADSLFTRAQISRAESYAGQARLLSWSSLGLSLIVVVALAASGLGSAMMRRLPGSWWVRTVLGVALTLLGVRLVTLPFALLLLRLRRDYGLTTQRVPAFLLDLTVSQLVETVGTALVVLLVVGCARRWRTWWPLICATVLGALVVLVSFVYPVLVEPLSNDFTTLGPRQLREEVTELADEMDVQLDDVVVVDASRRTTTLNAWVSGLGSTRRVVLYDNLVTEVPGQQVRSVVAHELAHARHQDVLTGTVLGALGAMAAVGLLGASCTRSDGRRRVAAAATVPVLLALLAVGAQVVAPVENGISRRLELRADADALAATGDPEAFVAVQRALALRSLADPTPPRWSSWWWGSHPGVLERVALARR